MRKKYLQGIDIKKTRDNHLIQTIEHDHSARECLKKSLKLLSAIERKIIVKKGERRECH